MPRSSGGRHHLQAQAIERALRLRDRCRGNLGIAGSCRQLAVAEHLDDADVDAAFQQMRGEQCLKVCTLIFLVSPAALVADRQTA